MSDVQKFGEEFQRVGKNGFDAAVSSFGEMNKGLQAIAAEVTDYSKKAFEDGTRAFEQLLGAKSFEQVIEIQSQYAKRAYEAYIAELSKLGEMYAGLTRNAYKPVAGRLIVEAPSSNERPGFSLRSFLFRFDGLDRFPVGHSLNSTEDARIKT